MSKFYPVIAYLVFNNLLTPFRLSHGFGLSAWLWVSVSSRNTTLDVSLGSWLQAQQHVTRPALALQSVWDLGTPAWIWGPGAQQLPLVNSEVHLLAALSWNYLQNSNWNIFLFSARNWLIKKFLIEVLCYGLCRFSHYKSENLCDSIRAPHSRKNSTTTKWWKCSSKLFWLITTQDLNLRGSQGLHKRCSDMEYLGIEEA